MNKNYYIFLSLITTCSCVNTKKLGTVHIFSKQEVYKNEQFRTNRDEIKRRLRKITIDKSYLAKVTEKSDEKILQIDFVKPDISKASSTTSEKLVDISRSFIYFPYKQQDIDDKPKSIRYKKYYYRGHKFKYLEIFPVFQALTIPIKLRPAIRDSIKSTAVLSANVGLAYGYKFVWNKHRNFYNISNDEVLKSNTTKFSFTPGIFAGPIVTSLSKDNTDGVVYKDKSRDVIGLTIGTFGSIGINKFNVGLAGGVDLPIGSNATDWYYYGKPWIGIVVALNFID